MFYIFTSFNFVFVAIFYLLIFQGTYITTGVDLKELEDFNIPEEYFYGKYKLTAKIQNVKNEVLSCVVIEYSLVRPWETSID